MDGDSKMAKQTFIKPFGPYEHYGQKNDIRKTTYTKYGKEVNVYDEIQANRVDTEIVPTLRKYGNLKPLEMDYQGMYGEFQNMDLRDVYQAKDKAEKLYNELPADIKAQFNDDPREFMEKAPKWLDEKIKTLQAQQPKPTEPTNKEEPTEGDKK